MTRASSEPAAPHNSAVLPDDAAGVRDVRPMAWWSTGLLLAIPGVWLGLLIGISLIEAPLKFTAPGITLPLGLGIGRRVFFAMNLVEAVLAVVVVMAAGRALGVPWQSRAERSGAARWIWPSVLGAVALLAIKTAVIRPFLNRRTDAVLAGLDAGGSSWHYAYVAVDGLLILLMIALLVFTVRTFAAPRA